jgi:hypothetical protein
VEGDDDDEEEFSEYSEVEDDRPLGCEFVSSECQS